MNAADPNLEAIVQFAKQTPDGVSLAQMVAHVNGHRRTVQHWLAQLVDADRLRAKGKGRATRYVVPKPRPGATDAGAPPPLAGQSDATVPSSSTAISQQPAVGAPAIPSPTARQPAVAVPSVSPAISGQASVPGASIRPATARRPAGTVPTALPSKDRQSAVRPRTAGTGDTDTDSGWREPPADAPYAHYAEFEELYDHIFPDIVRACRARMSAEVIVREQAEFDYRTDPRRKEAFIVAAMAKLDALTVADVRPYGVGPATYADWRARWNEAPGTRHW